MLIRLRGYGPLHRRLYHEIRSAILDGRVHPGQRIPSTRALADELDVSRTVVLQAYDRLQTEGYVVSRVGSGTYVAEGLPIDRGEEGPGSHEELPAPPVSPRLSSWSRDLPSRLGPTAVESDLPFDFRYGRPGMDAFPRRTWRRILSRTAARPPAAYGDPRGSPRLRAALADYLARNRAVRTEPEGILVVTGSQQALDLTARVLLDRGDGVVLEEPHYQGARHVFQGIGARLLPVATDERGLRTEALPRKGPRPRLAYVTPSHHFPRGGVLPLRRRLELLEWAAETGAMVLEDDYDSEYRYDAPPVEAVQGLDRHGRVLYAGTFSKILYPALRLGYLVLPPSLVEAFRAAKLVTDRHSPSLEQEALATLFEEGHFERHIRRSRTRFEARRNALLEALDRELGERVRVEGTEGGIHVVAWLPELPATRFEKLRAEAASRGVGVYPVAPYYLDPPERTGLLLGYASLTPERIGEGVGRLREAVDAVAGGGCGVAPSVSE